ARDPAEQPALGDAIALDARLDLLARAQPPDDRVRVQVERVARVVDEEPAHEARIAQPIDRVVRPEPREERGVEIAVQARHHPADGDDHDAEAAGLAARDAHAQRKQKAAIGVVQEPHGEEHERHHVAAMRSAHVEEEEAQRRRQLHQEPAEPRPEADPEARRREPSVRRRQDPRDREHEDGKSERASEQRVVRRIARVPAHGAAVYASPRAPSTCHLPVYTWSRPPRPRPAPAATRRRSPRGVLLAMMRRMRIARALALSSLVALAGCAAHSTPDNAGGFGGNGGSDGSGPGSGGSGGNGSDGGAGPGDLGPGGSDGGGSDGGTSDGGTPAVVTEYAPYF